MSVSLRVFFASLTLLAFGKTFVAEAPELSGCMVDGVSYEEALANVEIVMQQWIETAKKLGRPIPESRGRLVFA